MAGEAEKGADQGAQNLADAVGGKTGMGDMNPEQIAALGGELDDDLDTFDPSAEDRGDSLEPVTKDEDEDKDDDEEKDDEEDKDGDDESEDDGEDKSGDDDGDGDESDADEDDDEKDSDDDSEDDEGDEADDDSEEEEEEAGKKKPGDQPTIPKKRFDEVNARRREAEEEVARLKAEKKAGEDGDKDEFDFEAAEVEYQELLLDGKTKEAAAKRSEIRVAEKAAWQTEQSESTESTVTQREVQRELSGLAAEYEAAYDTLNPDSDDFSEDVVDDIQAMFKGYLNARMDLTEGQCFTLAVDNAVRIYGLKKGDEGATDNKKGGDDDEEKPPKNTRRKPKKDVKKKLEKAKKAPKDPGSAGDSSGSAGESADQPDVSQMSDDEFDALPDSTKARLRGDIA